MLKTPIKLKPDADRALIPILVGIMFISITTLSVLATFGPQNAKSTSDTIRPTPTDSKETTNVELDVSNTIIPGKTNLSNHSQSVTITKSGSYTLSGSSHNPVIVDADNAEVKIILDNAEISTTDTAAIIGLSAAKITIETASGTTNTLTDNGNSQYDGCIYSNTELFFTGSGTLKVTGQQAEGEGIATESANLTFQSGTYIITSADDGLNAGGNGATITINGGDFYINAGGDGIDSNKNAIINGGTIFVIGSDIGGDAGIDTDDGFAINGGTVIALGSDMIETPLSASKQNSLAFTLDQSISKDTIVTLAHGNKNLISFIAPKSFRTIIISTEQLVSGDYELYTGGSHTGQLKNGIYSGGEYRPGQQLNINGISSFVVNKTINQFGRTR